MIQTVTNNYLEKQQMLIGLLLLSPTRCCCNWGKTLLSLTVISTRRSLRHAVSPGVMMSDNANVDYSQSMTLCSACLQCKYLKWDPWIRLQRSFASTESLRGILKLRRHFLSTCPSLEGDECSVTESLIGACMCCFCPELLTTRRTASVSNPLRHLGPFPI